MTVMRGKSAPKRSTVSRHAPRGLSLGDASLMTRAAIASVCVSTILIAAKGVAFLLSGSVAMLASLADSAIDLLASAGNLFAVRQAIVPSDHQHRFGHGKAEAVAGLAQGLLVAASMLFLVREAFRRLINPMPLNFGGMAIAVMVLSIVLTFVLVAYQRRVVRDTGSIAISADYLHYVGDLLTNFGVIVAIVLSINLGWHVADPLIGLAIAGVLAISAWQILRTSLDQLMDRELPEEDRQRIKSIVLGFGKVRGLHDLRTRAAGTQTFLQLHVEMDPALTLADAHEVSDMIEAALLKTFPAAEILIHLDPHGAELPPPLARS